MSKEIRVEYYCNKCDNRIVEDENSGCEDYTVYRCGCGVYYDLEKYTEV